MSGWFEQVLKIVNSLGKDTDTVVISHFITTKIFNFSVKNMLLMV